MNVRFPRALAALLAVAALSAAARNAPAAIEEISFETPVLAVYSDGTVYYVKNGLVATDYTGIVTQDGKKYYIANGKWDKSYTGTLKTRTKVYTIQNGVVTRTVNR